MDEEPRILDMGDVLTLIEQAERTWDEQQQAELATKMADGTEIGVITKKGALAQSRFALDESSALLREYNDYFGVRYPLPKLDNIAAPVKMVEYISHGLPVLSTDCTECKNFVETWGIGKTVQADPDSMARGIAEFAHGAGYGEKLMPRCTASRAQLKNHMEQ